MCPAPTYIYTNRPTLPRPDTLPISMQRLAKTLDYGTPAEHPSADDSQVLVTPRFCTISPWSSKATDILRNSGLARLRRIERGVAYSLSDPQEIGRAHV